jgi:putative acetyltransferase
VHIRAEEPSDFDEIERVVRAAFGDSSDEVVDIVNSIRASEHYVPDLSLIATDGDHIVGHVMLSYALLGKRRVLILSPLAVQPDRQREGIGQALSREALTRADRMNEPLVLVLGIPAYYPKLGFESARALGIEPANPEIPDEPWMVKRLSNYDPSLVGTALFPPTDVS